MCCKCEIYTGFQRLSIAFKNECKNFTNIAILLHIKITSTDIQLTILLKLILPVSFVAQISIGWYRHRENEIQGLSSGEFLD